MHVCMDGQVKNSASSDPQDRQQEHNTTKMSDYTLPKLAVSDHGLRDSASCVNSDWACQWKMAKFNTAQGPHPLTDYQKNVSQVIMSASPTAMPNLVQMCEI